MLGWHLARGQVAHPLWLGCHICLGSGPEESQENLPRRNHQTFTLGPGRPGCPVFPLKPWKKKQGAATSLTSGRGHVPFLPQVK